MKLPLAKLRVVQSMRRVSLPGRCPSRNARALSGSEKVDLTSLSCGWWIGPSGMKGKKVWKAKSGKQKIAQATQRALIADCANRRASFRMGQFQLERMKISQNKSHRCRLSRAGAITWRLSTIQRRDGARPSKPFVNILPKNSQGVPNASMVSIFRPCLSG